MFNKLSLFGLPAAFLKYLPSSGFLFQQTVQHNTHYFTTRHNRGTPTLHCPVVSSEPTQYPNGSVSINHATRIGGFSKIGPGVPSNHPLYSS